MENRIPIEELVSKVLSELDRLNYAYNTICGYRAFYKRVISFAKARGEIYFSEALGRDFLAETYNCTVNYYQEAMPKGLKGPIRRIRVLSDYQLHGVIIRRIVKKPGYVKPPQFESELTVESSIFRNHLCGNIIRILNISPVKIIYEKEHTLQTYT